MSVRDVTIQIQDQRETQDRVLIALNHVPLEVGEQDLDIILRMLKQRLKGGVTQRHRPTIEELVAARDAGLITAEQFNALTTS